MSTTANVASDVATVVQALAGSPTRMLSNVRTDLDAITAGATLYQLLVTAVGRTVDDSKSARVLAQIDITLHHMLADATDEEAYCEGNLQTNLTAMTVRTWLEDLASVFDVPEDSDFEVEQTREGNVYSTTLTTTVSVQP